MKINRKGFTLIELLIVIAIIAVLATVVILSLNPAELLRQSRDSNRLSDMATMKSAVSLYLADVANPYLGTSGKCYVNVATTTGANVVNATSGADLASTDCSQWVLTSDVAAGQTNVIASTARGIGVATTTAEAPGNGWIPVDFSNISSGSPIGQEPIDPSGGTVGSATCSASSPSSCALYYSYVVSSGGTTFKISAKMESTKYANTAASGADSGGSNAEFSDGGNDPYMAEGGTNPAL